MYKEAQEKAEKDKKTSPKDGGEAKSDAKKSKKGKKDPKVVDADFEDVTDNKDAKKDNDEKSA